MLRYRARELEQVASRGDRFVADDRVLRHQGCQGRGNGRRRQGARRQIRALEFHDVGFHAGAHAEFFCEPLERVQQVVRRVGQLQDRAGLREHAARLAGIGKERHRRLRADEDQVLDVLQRLQRLLDRIGHALDIHPSGTPLHPGIRLLRQQPHAGRLGNPARHFQRVGAQGNTRKHQRRALAGADGRNRGLDVRLQHLRPGQRGRHCTQWRTGLGPGGIGWQDQRCDTPGSGSRLRDGLRCITGNMVGVLHPADPVRHGTRQALDVAGQRRVVFQVIGCVIADDVDDRRAGAPGVVQIGQAVGQARAQVQQRRRRLFRHPGVAVGGAGHHAFEQSQHAAHTGLAVERGHEMHFGSARIGKAGVDTAGQQGVAEGVRAVHIRSLSSWSWSV